MHALITDQFLYYLSSTKFLKESYTIDQGLKLNLLRGTHEDLLGNLQTALYNADATTAVFELTRNSFCIFISCGRYNELQTNHFQPSLRSY